jgi:putative transposase
MDEYESLSHTKWECKYHVVFIPQCRRRTLYGQLRQHLGEVFRKLAAQKESLLPDHVHMMIAIPPKYAVSPIETGAASATPSAALSGSLLLGPR